MYRCKMPWVQRPVDYEQDDQNEDAAQNSMVAREPFRALNLLRGFSARATDFQQLDFEDERRAAGD